MAWEIINGDCLESLRSMPDGSVHCCVTSPPYFGLRDYGHEGQIGLEQTPDEYVSKLVSVFRDVKRVLRDDGTLWLNLGDSYNNRAKIRTSSHQPALNGFKDDNWAERASLGGCRMSIVNGDLKEKDIIGIPWMVAFALRADGWYLRQDIIWHKPNPMPESVRDRCTKAHEYVFLLSKSPQYYFDHDSIKEPSVNKESYTGRRKRPSMTEESEKIMANFGATRSGFKNIPSGKTYPMRNRRDVWVVNVKPYKGAHFATFPPDLIRPCVLAGCPMGGTVLDPFAGSGTTGQVALEEGRNAILLELNGKYVRLIEERMAEAERQISQKML